MIEYPKIETLFDRDDKFKVIPYDWRLPEFDYLKNNRWQFTEKIDGTNIRVMWLPEVGIKFGGKSDDAQIPPFLLRNLVETFTPAKMRDIFPDSSVCLYGEGYGAKIQKGGGNYIPNGVNFILFDVLIDKWWLERSNCEDISQKLGISIVPIVGQGTLNEAVTMAKSGFKSTFGNFAAEGIVVKPLIGLQTRSGNRIVGKLKAKDF